MPTNPYNELNQAGDWDLHLARSRAQVIEISEMHRIDGKKLTEVRASMRVRAWKLLTYIEEQLREHGQVEVARNPGPNQIMTGSRIYILPGWPHEYVRVLGDSHFLVAEILVEVA